MPTEWRCEQQAEHTWRVFANVGVGEAYCDLVIEPRLLALARESGQEGVFLSGEIAAVVQGLAMTLNDMRAETT